MHVAALQLALSDDIDANIEKVSAAIREAAARGAKVILPSELFEGHYFCKTEEDRFFARAQPTAAHKSVIAMQEASVAFSLMVEVRNKLVESYQELMRMQV